MPIFEYECGKCGTVSEFLVGVTSDAEKPHCRKCGSKKVTKVFSVTAAVQAKDEAPTCGAAPSCPHAGSCGCH